MEAIKIAVLFLTISNLSCWVYLYYVRKTGKF